MTLKRQIKKTAHWSAYTIMHGNQKVVKIYREGTCRFYSKKMMPYNLYLENTEQDDIESRVQNLENFYYWCASRVKNRVKKKRQSKQSVI